MKRVIAHLLTSAGTPICKVGNFCETHHVTCGQRSLAEARRARLELARKGVFVIVARGSCPEYRFWADGRSVLKKDEV